MEVFMNISKKLLAIAVFALSTQQIAQGYFDAAQLKTEVTQILDFAQVLRKQNTSEAKKVAKWLETQINNDAQYINNSNTTIISIAKTVTSSTTIDAKIATLTQKMVEELATQAEEKAAREKQQKEWDKENAKNVKKHEKQKRKLDKEYAKAQQKYDARRKKEQTILAFILGIEVSALAVLGYIHVAKYINNAITSHDEAMLNKASEMFKKKWFA